MSIILLFVWTFRRLHRSYRLWMLEVMFEHAEANGDRPAARRWMAELEAEAWDAPPDNIFTPMESDL